MASDVVVALSRATPDGATLFGHNSNRPRGEAASLIMTPGRDHAPGETIRAGDVELSQGRRTWAVLAGRPGNAWGYTHGVNEKGVAVGCAAIDTLLECDGPCLSGPDLVRLGLGAACKVQQRRQAVEVVTDLVCRRTAREGARAATSRLSSSPTPRRRSSWRRPASSCTLGHVGMVRAVAGTCMLRAGLGTAFHAGYRTWPSPGAGGRPTAASWTSPVRLGRPGAGHARALRRWGRATMTLEHHSGQVDLPLLRRLLRDQAEMLAPQEGPPAEEETSASLIVRLGPAVDDLPVAWFAPGSPAASVYLPVFPAGDLPGSYSGPLWLALAALAGRGPPQSPNLRPACTRQLAGLQEQFDEHLHDFAGEGPPPAPQRKSRRTAPVGDLVHGSTASSGWRNCSTRSARAPAPTAPGSQLSWPFRGRISEAKRTPCPRPDRRVLRGGVQICGQTIRVASASTRHQEVPCPGCGEKVFVLPLSPFVSLPSGLPAASGPSRLWWRAPLYAAIACLVGVLVVFVVARPFLSRPDRTTESVRPGEKTLPEKMEAGLGPALGQGKFHVARQLLEEAAPSSQGSAQSFRRRHRATNSTNSTARPTCWPGCFRSHWTRSFARDNWSATPRNGRCKWRITAAEASSSMMWCGSMTATAGPSWIKGYEGAGWPTRKFAWPWKTRALLHDLPLDDQPRLIFGGRLRHCSREGGGRGGAFPVRQRRTADRPGRRRALKLVFSTRQDSRANAGPVALPLAGGAGRGPAGQTVKRAA